jgi:DNA-binding NtrC family response regulator
VAALENHTDTEDPPGNGCPDRAKCTSLEQRVEDVERQIIVESLRRHNYHRIRTARDLGISRVTLYNKMKKFGMLKS